MVFGLKKVTCGGPINFLQWNLDTQVRGLRMEVDKDNDLIALPVVVVDPTKSQVSANPVSVPLNEMIYGAGVIDSAVVWQPAGPAASTPSSYFNLLSLSIDPGSCTLAVPDLLTVIVSDTTHVPSMEYAFWCEAAASFKASKVFTFPYPGVPMLGQAVAILDAALLSGNAVVTSVGYLP